MIPKSAGPFAALLAFFFAFTPVLPGQTISPERQSLLARKGELLKEIKALEQQKSEAQATVTQGNSLRDMANAATQPDQAKTYADAVGLAQQAIAAAGKKIAEDQERLDAINRALTWEDSVVPRAVATIARGKITVETKFGSYPFDPTAPVRIGDHITVGGDGFLELQLEDGSEMHLGPNTDFEYARDVQGVYYEIFRGELHKISIIMSVRGANDQPRYRGCTAIAAVRGTDFTLESDGTQDVFTVFEGEIEVDPGAGRDKVTLKGGQKLSVPKSGSVGPPVVFDSKGARRWWE